MSRKNQVIYLQNLCKTPGPGYLKNTLKVGDIELSYTKYLAKVESQNT